MKQNSATKFTIGRLALAVLGSFLVGVGIAFNASANLGNDPIGLVYDGVRQLLGLAPEQIGLCAELSNYALILLLLLVGRRHVNIGTLVAVLPYRLCMKLGIWLYEALFPNPGLGLRILSVGVGCFLLYTGIAVFLTADIGMEPITGVIMVIGDLTHRPFMQAKWIFDFSMLGLGWLLGGQLGLLTFITAIIAGPTIDLLYRVLRHLPQRRRRPL